LTDEGVTAPDLQADAITTWLATNLGATVTSMSRQPRWRPVWFVEAQRDGRAVRLCVRGDRTDV
jgi:hypothetical protein